MPLRLTKNGALNLATPEDEEKGGNKFACGTQERCLRIRRC